MPKSHTIHHFKDLDKDDLHHIGTKGVTFTELVHAGFPIPEGFIISSSAYFMFLKEHSLITKINHLLQSVNFSDASSLLQTSGHIQRLIRQAAIPETLQTEIVSEYQKMNGMLHDLPVVLRSSITTDALPSLHLAGQRDTVLSVEGEAALILTIKEIWASLFEARALYYRHEKNFDHFRIGIAIIVQKMINPEVSGVLFTIDPLTHTKNLMIIEAVYGLRDTAGTTILPNDRYILTKDTGMVSEKNITEQSLKREKVGTAVHTVAVAEGMRKSQKISDTIIHALAVMGKKLEKHTYFPLEIEWAYEQNQLSIINLRHISTIPQSDGILEELPSIPPHVGATPLAPGIISGPLKRIEKHTDLREVQTGDIVVLERFTIDDLSHLRKAGGIITSQDTYMPHELIAAKQLGIPIIAGVLHQTTKFTSGSIISMNGSTGEISQGGIRSTMSEKPVRHYVPKSSVTKIYLSPNHRTTIPQLASSDFDGVGVLTSAEIMESIGVHPKKLQHDGDLHRYTQQLSQYLEEISRAFAPRPVLYSLTEGSSHALRKLVGGKVYEPSEANPLLGYRGAHRLLHDGVLLNAELEVIKQIREKGMLKNLHIMLPLVRSVPELMRLKKHIVSASLTKSPTFKLWMSIDTPENVILLESYLKQGIDGVAISIDSLQTLFTGIDRDNSEVAASLREDNEALTQAYHFVIKLCHKYNIPCTIYGSNLGHNPVLIEKLVRWGITSITISPDALENVRQTIYKYERKLIS